MNPIVETLQLSDGRTISIETGKLAKQADGAAVVRMGKTMLLATVVAKHDPGAPPMDFLPLYVDYQEKFAATGKIPGGFLRREGRLGDHEVLTARLVDRAIRPLFPKYYTSETQVNIALISAEPDVLPDALAALAASTALMLSRIPFKTPISEVRVARIEGQFHINPTPQLLERADMDLIVAASEESVIMVEGEMQEVQEEEMVEAIQAAHEAIKDQCKAQIALAKAAGKLEQASQPACAKLEKPSEDWQQAMHSALYEKVYGLARQGRSSKKVYQESLQQLKQSYIDSVEGEVEQEALQKYFSRIEKEAVRNLVLNESTRLDGRKLDQVRPIEIDVDYLPAAHGSALFTRGETQSLTTVTLGSKTDEQIIDRAMLSGYSKFMLHYNFPGFSTGEVKPNRGPARREIGHGNLAMRALKRVLPPEDDNPYTLRIVSDILESNGSSSMATVCAGSIALMDAGVRITNHVSGIAMGLVLDAEAQRHAVLSDILGDEDHLGDMDFKVAGTRKGITACQMDIKVAGVSYQVLQEALAQSRAGRLHILEKMEAAIACPRQDYKPHTPRIVALRIPKDAIGAVIGPGGKVIQKIQRDTGASISVEEEGQEGIVKFFAADREAVSKAEAMVKDIVAVPEVGATYTGKVKSIKDFGAFVEFMPGKDGLLHISEVKWERVENLSQILEEGEQIQVKLIEVDPKTGKFRLSRKALLPKPAAQ